MDARFELTSDGVHLSFRDFGGRVRRSRCCMGWWATPRRHDPHLDRLEEWRETLSGFLDSLGGLNAQIARPGPGERAI